MSTSERVPLAEREKKKKKKREEEQAIIIVPADDGRSRTNRLGRIYAVPKFLLEIHSNMTSTTFLV